MPGQPWWRPPSRRSPRSACHRRTSVSQALSLTLTLAHSRIFTDLTRGPAVLYQMHEHACLRQELGPGRLPYPAKSHTYKQSPHHTRPISKHTRQSHSSRVSMLLQGSMLCASREETPVVAYATAWGSPHVHARIETVQCLLDRLVILAGPGFRKDIEGGKLECGPFHEIKRFCTSR